MLNVKKFVFNDFQVNTYIVWEDNFCEGIIFDPGCNNKREEEILLQYVEENQIKIKYLFNTHLHIDHIMGNYFIKNKYNPKFLVPQKDLPLFEQAIEFAKDFNLRYLPSPEPDGFIDSFPSIKLGEEEIQPLFTAGHTPGEFSFFIESINVCLTGDVLFKDSIGRTDFWGGDYQTLKNSIVGKLLALNDEVTILPGHGEHEKLGIIKRTNSFILNF